MPSLDPEKIKKLLLNPPYFEGTVMRGASENSRATIQHPNKGTVRARVIGGDLMSGKAAVFQLQNGGFIVTGRPNVVKSDRRDGGLITVPGRKKVDEQRQIIAITIAVLFKKRNGANWDFWVGGLNDSPIYITSVPIIKQSHSVSVSNTVNGSESVGDPPKVKLDLQLPILQTQNPIDISLEFSLTWTAECNQNSSLTGIAQWWISRYEDDPESLEPAFDLGSIFAESGELDPADFGQSGISQTITQNVTLTWLERFIENAYLTLVTGEASATGGAAPSATLALSASVTATIDELNPCDGWISPNDQGGFTVGIRYDIQNTAMANVQQYTVSRSGTVESGAVGTDYQSFKASGSLSNPSDLIDETTGINYFNIYPTGNTDQGLPGYAGSPYFFNFSNFSSFVGNPSLLPFYTQLSGEDYDVALIDPNGLIDNRDGSSVTVHFYRRGETEDDPVTRVTSAPALIGGWPLLDPASYKEIESITSDPDVIQNLNLLGRHGDLVMGTAVIAEVLQQPISPSE